MYNTKYEFLLIDDDTKRQNDEYRTTIYPFIDFTDWNVPTVQK